MQLLACSIPGDPVGKGRPRVALRGNRPVAYTPKKTESWETGAAELLRSAWAGRAPLDRPVAVVVRAIASRPQAEIPKPRPLAARPELAWRLARPTKPDADNVLKAALDALVRAGVLRDDVLAVDVRAVSLWVALTEGPSVEIEVSEIEGLVLGVRAGRAALTALRALLAAAGSAS